MNTTVTSLWFGSGIIVIVDKWSNNESPDVKIGVGAAVSLFGLWAISQFDDGMATMLAAIILTSIALTYGADLAKKLAGGELGK